MLRTSQEMSSRLSRLAGVRDDRKRHLETLQSTMDKLSEQKAELEEAVQVALSASHYIQNKLQFCITSIVTKALEAVFDDPYEFCMSYNTRGDKTLEVSLVLKRDGEEFDPMTACGGGVINVVSFALRIACLLITHPTPDRVLVMDEPFVHLSKDLQVRLRGMLEELSHELHIQFLIITHETSLEE